MKGVQITHLTTEQRNPRTMQLDSLSLREFLTIMNDEDAKVAFCVKDKLEEIAQAMIDLAIDPEGRKQMGEAGYKRVTSFYRIEQMKETYKEIYRRFAEEQQAEWTEEPFQFKR